MSEQPSDYRIETDSMGEMPVPLHAYWGAQTQRAVLNFPISGYRFNRPFIRALGLLKRAAAETNIELGLLDEQIGAAIVRAAGEVEAGQLDEQFVVDIFQTGSGTSTNMNANEVIASRANGLLGGALDDKTRVHPNDHVNRGQSSNDLIPTALHISGLTRIEEGLLPALDHLWRSLGNKAREFEHVLKIGRTHLQDATPMRLGQQFSGYSAILARSVERVRQASEGVKELPIGGTAVGTGINTHVKFAGQVIRKVNQSTGLQFREAENHFEAQGSRDAVVHLSASLKTVALSLTKIANDIRWLGSGPRAGIGELELPAVQPGSSIMPGKVNPVIAESLLQVCAQVIGNDATIGLGGMSGNFELNVMMPVMAHNLLESIDLLTSASRNFASRCVDGLKANEERCSELVEQSLAMCTSLAPHIGYDRAAAIAKEAFETGQTVREVATSHAVLPEARLSEILDPRRMSEPDD